jgi:CBS domain containing-hemolysin-like protein
MCFKAALNHQEIRHKRICSGCIFIPETASVSTALEKISSKTQHLFVVVDEYGAVSGLITMEDVLERFLVRRLWMKLINKRPYVNMQQRRK